MKISCLKQDWLYSVCLLSVSLAQASPIILICWISSSSQLLMISSGPPPCPLLSLVPSLPSPERWLQLSSCTL